MSGRRPAWSRTCLGRRGSAVRICPPRPMFSMRCAILGPPRNSAVVDFVAAAFLKIQQPPAACRRPVARFYFQITLGPEVGAVRGYGESNAGVSLPSPISENPLFFKLKIY